MEGRWRVSTQSMNGQETGLADVRKGRERERQDNSPSSFSILRSTLTRFDPASARLQVSVHRMRGCVPIPARRADAVRRQVCYGHYNSWVLRFEHSQTVLICLPVGVELRSSSEAISAEVAFDLGQQIRHLSRLLLSLLRGRIRWPGSRRGRSRCLRGATE